MATIEQYGESDFREMNEDDGMPEIFEKVA